MNAYAVLKFKDFRNFLMARFTLTLALQMQAIAVAWQIYELTHKPFALGLIGLCEAIPYISIAMFGGHTADIISRKKIIIITTSILLLCSSALLLLSFYNPHSHMYSNDYPGSSLISNHLVFIIYFIIFFTGLGRGFLYPAQMGLMAQLVPRELYTNSSTWNSLLFHIAAVLGPAIGGLMYGFFGVTAAFTTVFVLIFIGLVLYLNIKNQPMPERKVHESLFDSLSTGIKFVFHHQILLGAMSLDMLAVLFGGAVSMLPVFANDILHVGPQGLGFLRAAPATGAIMMSFYLAHYPPSRNTGRKLLLAVTGFGLCIIFFALSKNFYLSCALLLLSGVCDNVSVVIRQTIMQLFTPDEMRGRVAAVNGIFIGSSNEIGAFESGLAAKIMRLIPSVIFGGCMTLLIAGSAYKIAPKLRNLSLNSKSTNQEK